VLQDESDDAVRANFQAGTDDPREQAVQLGGGYLVAELQHLVAAVVEIQGNEIFVGQLRVSPECLKGGSVFCCGSLT
jgi:hypothetical protein